VWLGSETPAERHSLRPYEVSRWQAAGVSDPNHTNPPGPVSHHSTNRHERSHSIRESAL
jgi:hypothetical protein